MEEKLTGYKQRLVENILSALNKEKVFEKESGVYIKMLKALNKMSNDDLSNLKAMMLANDIFKRVEKNK